jgi:hypothetical protein
VDLLKQLDVGDSLFVVGDDVVVFNTCKGVAVLKVAVVVLTESFITAHSHFGEVVSIDRMIVGRLVVGREEARQSFQRGDALCWEIVKPQEWCLAHHKGEVSRHVVFIASTWRLSSHRSGALPITRGKYPAMWSILPLEARACMLYILSHILGSERSLYFSIDCLKSLGYLIVQRRREKDGKLLTAPRLADGA